MTRADMSALPRIFCQVGHECAQSSGVVDAQGGQLHVQDVGVGKLQFGDVSFQERFTITVRCLHVVISSELVGYYNPMTMVVSGLRRTVTQ